MTPETISFMPNGDITLLLTRHVYEEIDPSRSSTSVPAVPEIDEDKLIEEALGIEPDAPDAEKEDESYLFFAPDAPGSNDGPMYPPVPRGRRGTWESEQRERSRSPPAGFWARLKRQSEAVDDSVIDADVKPHLDPATTGEEPQVKIETKERILVSSHEVHCIVSSRHLILASQFFQVLLTGASTFATSLRLGHQVNISLPTVDLETMVILLNIVHGLSRKVPRQLSLSELSQLAVMARKFGMQDTVQFFSDTWIDAAQRDGLPKVYEEDATNIWWCIYVFWAFDRETEFKEMTKLVQRKCDNTVEEDVENVPVPKIIIDTIRRDREFAIETALTVIHTLITRYMDGDTICDSISDGDVKYACDAMILGSLIKGSKKIGFWPRPVSPFEGKRFQDLAAEVRGIRVLDVCEKGRRGTFGKNCHGLEDEIGKSMRDIEMGLDGLEVADYKVDNENFEEAWQLIGTLPETADLEEKVEEIAESPVIGEEKRLDATNGYSASKVTDTQVPSAESTPRPAKSNLDDPSMDVTGSSTEHTGSFWEEKPLEAQSEHRNRSEERVVSAPTIQFPVNGSSSLLQEKTTDAAQKPIQIREQSPNSANEFRQDRPDEPSAKYGNRLEERAVSAPATQFPVNGSRNLPQEKTVPAQNFVQVREQRLINLNNSWEENSVKFPAERRNRPEEELVSASVTQLSHDEYESLPQERTVETLKSKQIREQSLIKPNNFWEERPVETPAERRHRPKEELPSGSVTQFPVKGSRILPQENQIVALNPLPIGEQTSVELNYGQKPEYSATSFAVQERSVPPLHSPHRKEIPVRKHQNGHVHENYPSSIENLLAIAQKSDDMKSGNSTARYVATAPTESSGHVREEEHSRQQAPKNLERVQNVTGHSVAIVPEQYLGNGEQESRNSRDLSLRQRIQSPPPQQQMVNRLRGDNTDPQQRSRRSSPVSDSLTLEPRTSERERTLTHQFSRDFQEGGARISPRNSGERVSRQDWDPNSFSVTSGTHHQEPRSTQNGVAKNEKKVISPMAKERVVMETRGDVKSGDMRGFLTKSLTQETRLNTNGDKPASGPRSSTPQDVRLATKKSPSPMNLHATTKPTSNQANLHSFESANYPDNRQAEERAVSVQNDTANTLSGAKSLHSLVPNSRKQTKEDITAFSSSRNQTKEDNPAYTNGSKPPQPSILTNPSQRNKSQSPFREDNGYGKSNSNGTATISSLQPEIDIDNDEVDDIMGRINEDDVGNTKDAVTAGISITTDGEETWAPSQNFKMRKSKKKFSTRF